jgi:energy-coupling factor transporter ATP-binding protein EcfA2
MPGISEITPKKAERALIIGGTRSGKSTLMDHFIRQMVKERPGVQILLLDTKPRFRAEVERYGPQNRLVREASKPYADWESGPILPGSVRVDIHREKPLERFWRPDDRSRVAIAQTELTTERGRLLEIADDWYNVRQKKSDRVLAVDELLDHYHRNTISIHGSRDVPLKVVRAGGERGFGGLYGAQRPKRSSAANYGRAFGAVPISLEVLGGYQIFVGYGSSYGYRASQ